MPLIHTIHITTFIRGKWVRLPPSLHTGHQQLKAKEVLYNNNNSYCTSLHNNRRDFKFWDQTAAEFNERKVCNFKCCELANYCGILSITDYFRIHTFSFRKTHGSLCSGCEIFVVHGDAIGMSPASLTILFNTPWRRAHEFTNHIHKSYYDIANQARNSRGS